MKSFEAKISKAFKPSKSVETEKVKRKTVKAENYSASCGNGVIYTFKADTGTLTISKTGDGDGAMTSAPWREDSSIKSAIETVVIEYGVTSIYDWAFEGTYSLTSITIPDTVTSIGGAAFKSCQHLSSIYIPGSVTSFNVINGHPTFYDCGGLVEVGFGSNCVAKNFNDSFYTKANVKSIILGEAVDADASDFSSDIFSTYTGLKSVELHSNSAVSRFKTIFSSSLNSINSVTIGDGVTNIGEESFISCGALSSATIGNDVTSIGEKAFKGCTSLSEVNIGNKVTSIEQGAFIDCSSLTNVTIPNSVESIGIGAFGRCSSLTSFIIPDSVTSIEDNTFNSCTGLNSVHIGNSVTSIGDSAFFNCKGLTSLAIPDKVTTIDPLAFGRCTDLRNVTYAGTNDPADGVVNVNVFPDCTQLSKVHVPCNYKDDKFCGINVLRSPSEAFSNSESFSASEPFSASADFSSSGSFSASKPFSASVDFSSSGSFSASKPFSASADFSNSGSFSASNPLSASDSFSTSESFSASEPLSASDSFSTSESFSASNPLSASADFSTSGSFSTSESFSPSVSFSDTVPISLPDPPSIEQPSKKSTNIAVIAGAVAAVAAVAIVATAVLVCYLKKLVCFGPKADRSNSEFEANSEMWSVEGGTMTIPVNDNLYSCNSDVAEDPFIHIME